MSPGRPRSGHSFEGDPLSDPSLEQSLMAVSARAGAQFDVLGPLGRDAAGAYAFLARETSTARLVVLKHSRSDSSGGRGGGLQVIEQLDSSVPPPAGSCPVCHAPFTSWDPTCTECGSNVAGTGFAAPGTSLDEVLARVRGAAQGYEVLGTMTRAVGGEPVFFARDFPGGHLVALRLEPEGGTGRGSGYAISATRMMRPKSLSGASSGEPRPDFGASRGTDRPWTPIPSPSFAMPAGGISGPQTPSTPPTGEKVCPECRGTFGPELRFCPRDGSALRSPTNTEELIGRVVAERYRIISKLGQGGMGTVYLAEHVRMGRRCAIKVMNPVLLHDPDSINRFSREASNASRINHPHVAAIYDFGETSDEIVYLAMEFVEGESLAAMLDRKRGIREQRAMEIGCQVADALSAAHDLGIVHRDLKPDNVMVCHAKGKALVKVVDFGIAKATQGGSQTVTRTGYVVGTPAYMSPEQILGDPLDGRSDLYSLGCILYEMLTGERAFVGPSGEVSLRRRLTEPPPRPRKVKGALSKSLDAIVIKAMARSPEDRFQSAAELRDALIAALKERDSRPGLRRWLARGESEEAADTSDHDVVPSPPAFSPVPGLASAGFQPDGPAMEWSPGAGSPHHSGGNTKVIRHRSARTEGGLPRWMLGVAAGLVLVGFSLWLLPAADLLPRESSSASPSMPETTELAVDTLRPGDEAQDDSLPVDLGPVLTDPAVPPTDAVPIIPGVIRFEKSLPPGAQITVDSIDAQLTPEGNLSIAPGSHRVQVQAPGFRTAARTVVVSAGDTASLPLELARIDTTAQMRFPPGGVGPGQIIVNGKLPAGSQISVDGWPLAPGGRLVQVDSGAHWVAISAPGFEADSSSVRLGPGGRALWNVPRLKALPAQANDTSKSAEPDSEQPVSPSSAPDTSLPGVTRGE